MSKHTIWLRDQLDGWVQEGLIDSDVATAISARYPRDTGMSWSQFLLTAIGAIIFGLGIILFFAYNWNAIPKFGKLALIFATLALSHGVAWLIRQRNPGQRNLIEGFHLLGTMMFGAGIWLIAQIYHLDEHYPTALMAWGAGALLFAWCIPSVLQGIMAAVLLIVWGFSEITEFNSTHLLSPAILLFGVVSLAWILRSRVLLALGLAGFTTLSFLLLEDYLVDVVAFYLTFSTAVIAFALASFTRSSNFAGSADVLNFFAMLMYGCLLFIMTLAYGLIPREAQLSKPLSELGIAGNIGWIALALAVIASLVLVIRQFNLNMNSLMQSGLVLLSTLLLSAHAAGLMEYSWYMMLAFNAILAAHAVLLIVRGMDKVSWKPVTLGCLTLAVIIFARFNDLFDSLVMRAAVFVIFGAMLFAIGHMYSRNKARSVELPGNAEHA